MFFQRILNGWEPEILVDPMSIKYRIEQCLLAISIGTCSTYIK